MHLKDVKIRLNEILIHIDMEKTLLLYTWQEWQHRYSFEDWLIKDPELDSLYRQADILVRFILKNIDHQRCFICANPGAEFQE